MLKKNNILFRDYFGIPIIKKSIKKKLENTHISLNQYNFISGLFRDAVFRYFIF